MKKYEVVFSWAFDVEADLNRYHEKGYKPISIEFLQQVSRYCIIMEKIDETKRD